MFPDRPKVFLALQGFSQSEANFLVILEKRTGCTEKMAKKTEGPRAIVVLVNENASFHPLELE